MSMAYASVAQLSQNSAPLRKLRYFCDSPNEAILTQFFPRHLSAALMISRVVRLLCLTLPYLAVIDQRLATAIPTMQTQMCPYTVLCTLLFPKPIVQASARLAFVLSLAVKWDRIYPLFLAFKFFKCSISKTQY